ncbi:hypothetical protein CYLTODRAFT_380467 [Cylindrobasidium torrendii FP15055 ss-10]|uniref:CHAT domain-containing protein n=1 Tax=Cylindrobasidium torrendii FP15055 ss-10 TaxID=1314674 RepID=A0A0D7B5F5_9AGAR|nr:hypothetical protein CYLTODRAFT_380467 [Cylindrobasidium torrendii FP15055 ss-10]
MVPTGSDEAIVYENQVEMSNSATSDAGSWVNLAHTHFQRYQRSTDITDLHEAIRLLREAIKCTFSDYFEQSGIFSDLGSFLTHRFHSLGDINDINEAIKWFGQAIDQTPDAHADKPSRLTNLALAFLARFSRNPSHDDWKQASTLLTQAAHTSPQLSTVVHAAVQYIQQYYSSPQTPSMKMRHNMFCLHALVIDLVSEIVWLGHGVSRRYEEASGIGNAVSAAVAAALYIGYDWCALEWFEEGRAIVWAQILNLYSPVDGLRKKFPEYADRLDVLSASLKPDGRKTSAGNKREGTAEPTYHRLADEYKCLLAEIRQLDGFKEFLRPLNTTKLADAAMSGAVACINVDHMRSDAIILQRAPDGTPDVHFIPLPELSPSKVDEMKRDLGSFLKTAQVGRSRESRAGVLAPFDESQDQAEIDKIVTVLQLLWTSVVGPVIDSVASKSKRTQTPASGDSTLPRITWCTSGALSFLPLHAAGMYGDPTSSRKAFNEIVSSYTPTLTSLVPRVEAEPLIHPAGITIVAQPATPGSKPLPGTVLESQTVGNHFPHTHELLQGSGGTIASVLDSMARHPNIHLACHGVQDALDPLQSAFILHDGSLTLADLMSRDRAPGGLAFLSACETAVGDERAPSEVVHLAAGMLSAGYQSVVGTMWAIGDEDAPGVADAFYGKLQETKDVADIGDVALSLHHALEVLRGRVGEQNFVRWMPFVHYGK